MLISFSVSNFRSFGEEVTLDMIASTKLTDHPDHLIPLGDTCKHLVRSAMLYGPNAAGKSNLIKAMSYAQELIEVGSQSRFPAPDTFRFDPHRDEKPSSFEFRFLVDAHIFTYGFDVGRKGIQSEWLVALRGSREKPIFERDAAGVTVIGDAPKSFFAGDPIMESTLKALGQLPIRPTQLFLSRAISLPNETLGTTLQSIIQWLVEDLIILGAGPRSCDILDRLYDDSTFKSFAEQFLCKLDTGISNLTSSNKDVIATNVNANFWDRLQVTFGITSYYGCSDDMDERIDPDDPSKVITRQLISWHDRTDHRDRYPLAFNEESDGTQQLLHCCLCCIPKQVAAELL
ncbi:MAG: AAA family ATPase [Pirellulaceae bacterium]